MENTVAEYAAERERTSAPAGGLWIFQAISGLILVALLLLHMIAHHFVVEGGLRNFAQVVDYISNPVIFITTISFLIFATAHAMLGLRAVLMDLGISEGRQRLVNWVLAIAGVVAIVYGIWLEITIRNM